MATEGLIRNTNYYTPLTRLLCDGKAPAAKRAIVLSSFPQVADLWRRLDQWLRRTQGAFGVSTISAKDSPHRELIGLPLSQALVRRSDRMLLTQFFHDIELSPALAAKPDYLLRQLRIWADSRVRKFSRRFVAALESEVDRPLVTELVARLAESWDGKALDPATGHRMLKLVLQFTSRPPEFRWAAEVVKGVESGEIESSDGRTICFHQDESPFYIGIDQLPFSSSLLVDGFRVRGRDERHVNLAFNYSSERIVVFRKDPYLGCWVSQESTTTHDEHLILVHPEDDADVRKILKEASPHMRPVVIEHVVRALPQGWTLYSNVRFDDPAALSRALSVNTQASARLRPSPVGRPKLIGGLPVAKHLGRGFYLQGGAPDLLLATHGEFSREVSVALDGHKQEPPFAATGFPIPLALLELSSEKHEISADGHLLNFTLVERLTDVPVKTGTVGFPVVAQASSQGSQVSADNVAVTLTTVQSAIRGASGVGAVPYLEPCLVQRGALASAYISFQGEVMEIVEPKRPAWRDELVGVVSYYFEAEIPEESGWIVQRFARRVTARAVGRALPDVSAIREAPELDQWIDLVLMVTRPDNPSLWKAYRTVAEELRA